MIRLSPFTSVGLCSVSEASLLAGLVQLAFVPPGWSDARVLDRDCVGHVGASRRLEFHGRAAGVHQRFVHPEAVSHAAHVIRSPHGFLLFIVKFFVIYPPTTLGSASAEFWDWRLWR